MQAEPSAGPTLRKEPGTPRGPRRAFRSRLRELEPSHVLQVAALLALVPLLSWQLRSLSVPLLGEHNWRQADTYSVAYNFLHESADFFHPRIDWANERSGIMGMEAPIYPYLSFLAMSVFGDAAAVARVVAFSLYALGMFFFVRYLRPAGSTSVPIGALLMCLFSPMGLLEFRQVQPDGPMAALAMIAAACLHQFARTERRAWFAAGLGTFTLAALTKYPALAAGPAMWLFSWSARPTSLRKIAARGAWFALPVLTTFAWHAWARHLNEAYNGGHAYFAIDFSLAGVLHDITARSQLRHAFAAVIPCYVSNWVLFPAVLVGGALGFEPENRPLAAPMAAWFAGAALFLGAFSSRLWAHWYYATVIFPPVVYFGALGLGRLIELARTRPPAQPLSRFSAATLIPALLLTPLVAGASGEIGQVPGATRFPPHTTWMGGLPMLVLLVLFALAAGALQLRARRHRPYLWLAVVAAASVPGLARAGHDALASFKWRSRAAEWQTAETAWGDLRRAVNRYSTRQHRFVVDGANPWYLHVVLRKGFSQTPKDVTIQGLDWYRQRGARFLIHYPEAGDRPRVLTPELLLAKGKKWELYCLVEQGCPPLAKVPAPARSAMPASDP